MSRSPLGRFLAVGVASTLAYALLLLALRPLTGAAWANALALATTAVANTQANRRLTFGVTGRAGVARHQLQGLAVFGLALGLTSAALWTLHRLDPAPGAALEGAVLVLANLGATAARYLAMRSWIFAPRSAACPRP